MSISAIIFGTLIIVFVVLVTFFTSKSSSDHACHGNCRSCKYGDDRNCKHNHDDIVDLKKSSAGDENFIDTNNIYTSDDKSESND